MSRDRTDSFVRLARLGIFGDDARALLRISATLHTWHERECNGEIQRDEETGKPYWYNTHTGKRGSATPDRETPAIARASEIAGRHGLSAYIQTDPRGCALWIYNPTHERAGEIDSNYSSIATPVCS